MIPVSNDYIENVVAKSRLFKPRATITMDAFSQLAPITDTMTTDFTGKVSGSTVENPSIAKFAKGTSVQTVNTGSFTALAQGYYNAIMSADDNPFDVHAAVSGTYAQMLFQFDLVTLFERKYGTSFWQGGTTLAEKITVLKEYIQNLRFHWTGYGSSVGTVGTPATSTTTLNSVRYIRDYLNGNTVNANNYWNEIQATTAGGTNRATGITPTISSGTLTNGVNLTNGNTADYGYETSANGVQKYVQIDLGAVYNDVSTIKVWHYYADGRTFHGTKTQISSDGVNWTTLFDSAVSGEYAETSAGKSYTVPSTTTTTPATPDIVSYQVGITYWNASTNAWMWSAVLAPSHTSTTENILTVTDLTNLLDANGFVNFTAYTQYKSTANTPADLFTDYVELEFDIVFQNTRQYTDDTVMRFNVVEEISVLNDAVPSNELSLTLNNQSGDFDIINFSNISEVLASKPIIFIELGLVYDLPTGDNYLSNHSLDNFITSTSVADDWTTFSSGVTPVFTKQNGYIGSAQQIEVPAGGVGAINSGNNSPTIAAMQTVYIRFLFKGTLPNYVYMSKASGNQPFTNITVNPIIGSDWQEAIGSLTSNNTAAESVGLIIGHDTTASNVDTTILIDELYLSVYDYYDMTEKTEWIPVGRYFITQWKNDYTSKVITFTANDYFKLFSDTNYPPSTITNLHDLAADVLTKAGVPTNDQYIDSSLANITVGVFKNNVDCRTAIQHIAIAGRCCVYQDRYGNIVISPFARIDQASNYLSYPTTQNHIPVPYTGPSTYPLMSTGSGMRNLTYESMYNPPQIALEQVVKTLIVKVYDASGNSMPDSVFNNPSITGDSGSSFTIDNPLVISVQMATDISNWYFTETNFSAIYTIDWRQNPALECTDIILIEDPFQTGKQSRIIHQELDYEGYLTGTLQARGGLS